MSDTVWVALIAAVPGILSTILGFVNKNRIKENTVLTQATRIDVGVLESNTNSKMDKLLDAKDELRTATNAAAFAIGKLEGESTESTR